MEIAHVYSLTGWRVVPRRFLVAKKVLHQRPRSGLASVASRLPSAYSTSCGAFPIWRRFVFKVNVLPQH